MLAQIEDPLTVRDVFALASEDGVELSINRERHTVMATPKSKVSDSLRLGIKSNRRRLFKSLLMREGALWISGKLSARRQSSGGKMHDAAYTQCGETSDSLIRLLDDDVPEEAFLKMYRAFLEDVKMAMEEAA